MKIIAFSLLLITMIVAPRPSNAVTVKQIDSFIASGDKCLTHHLDRYIWVRGKDAEWKERPFNERYRTALKLYAEQKQNGNGFKTLFNGPWDRALVPVLDAQRDTIFDALLTADTTGGLMKGTEYDAAGNLLKLDALESYLRQNSYRKLPNMVQTVAVAFGAQPRKLNSLLNLPSDEAYSERIKKTAAIAAACAQLSVTLAPSCVSAVKALLLEANYSSNIILPNIWNEFIRTKSLREGIRQSALLMLKRIKSQTPGYFFDDLAQGFQLAGLPTKESVEAAWQLLALYGNGGANTGYRLLAFELPPEVEVLGVSLSFIGTAVTYLDFQQRIAGARSYALPPEVSGSCLTPKPYHFWLNAYFSRWLIKQGYSIEVAQFAAFILNKGYQVNRDVNNAGGGIEKLLSKPTNHPTNEVIRTDLILGATGNVYGSLVDNQRLKPIAIEEGLQRLRSIRGVSESLPQSSIVNQLVSDRIRFIKLWDELYQPNQSLLFFQMGQK